MIAELADIENKITVSEWKISVLEAEFEVVSISKAKKSRVNAEIIKLREEKTALIYKRVESIEAATGMVHDHLG